mgnify:CR=1 FL=1
MIDYNTRRKYSLPMETMLVKAFNAAPEGQTKLKTAKRVLKDMKKIFSLEKVKELTATGIAQKYYSLLKDKENIVEKHVTKKPKFTLRDNIFEAMKDSENMTITVKGTEITVVFK